MIRKMRKIHAFLAFLMTTGFFTACDLPMGLGLPVDLEPTKLRVLRIELEDGTVKPVFEEDNKLFVGPGILVGDGAVLYGEAFDNENVERIDIEEIGANAQLIDGKPQKWTTIVNAKKNALGWQEWSIRLDGIREGERVISITAFDKPENIGPESVQQLTLLVDTKPPFVKSVKIERTAGLQVDLLPKSILEQMDENVFDNVNYFQNERFTIRANITHDFSLSKVELNLLNNDGENIFSKGLEPSGGSLYTPYWDFTGEQLVSANAIYNSGINYLKVIIKATAAAGHHNEDMENTLYNLCWYPESDYVKIQTPKPHEGSVSLYAEKGAVIPITVFDDDNAAEVYAGLLSLETWENITGATDEEKLEYLKENRNTFSDETGDYILKTNRINAPISRTVIPFNVIKNRGEYRLVILAKDEKTSGAQGVWSKKAVDVIVVEEGIPIISVRTPMENTSPYLTDFKYFNIEGTIVNLDPVDFIRIAWIPSGLNYTAQQQISKGQEMLKSGISTDGVKIWSLQDIQAETIYFADKPFTSQEFSFEFDIFEDFKYQNILENEIKVFMLYTKGQGEEPEDIFYTIRLLPYKQSPVINILRPDNWDSIGRDVPVNFIIKPESESGLPITEVTLFSYAKGDFLELTFHEEFSEEGDNILYNVWTALDSHSEMAQYRYEIKAKDALSNEQLADLFIRVETPPDLLHITTVHNEGSVFSSRDEIKIQAVFSRAVEHVYTDTSRPRIILTGFTHGQERYADYFDGSASNTLVFVYDVQQGDDTGSGVLQAIGIQYRSQINASIPEAPLAQSYVNPLKDRKLFVKGISPVITGIDVKKADKSNAAGQNYAWHREGEVITIDVTLDKEARVLGSPRLILPFNGGSGENRYATFQTTVNNDKTLRFTYKVQNNDEYDARNLVITVSNCFSSQHLSVITDKVGAQGNYLALTGSPSQTSNVRVDSVKPAAPRILSTHIDGYGAQLTARPQDPVNSHRFIINNDLIETYAGTIFQYTTNGVHWIDKPVNELPYEFVLSDSTTYNVSARQIDRAGNIGNEYPFITFSLSGQSELVSIICDNPDGAYNEGSKLNFKLIFNGPVTSTGEGSVTLNGGTGTVTTPVVIPLPVLSDENPDFSLSFSWTASVNRHMNPVTIAAIDLKGVRRASGANTLFTSDENYSGKMTTVCGAFNRPGLEVLTIRPSITGGRAITNAVVSNNTLTLIFNTNVWPEKGYIRIKPTATGNNGNGAATNGNYLIPPVLTNDEYTRIRDALSSSSRSLLTDNTKESYYVRTTHGIKSDGTHYVPDTDTKYVLNFNSDLNNGTLRPLLNDAKYLWQEIEVVNEDKVSGSGSNTITVVLDTLPSGRQWKVEIDANSFRDRASNYFEGWGGANSGYWFWSAQTAQPVVRVERVSNNRAHSGSFGTLQTNVRYRIDCVTVGAVLTYGEWNRGDTFPQTPTIAQLRGEGMGTARIDAAMPGGNAPYVANANSGDQNSIIEDASVTEIETTLHERITNAYTMGEVRTIGDLSYYTARKDYIGASAKRSNLTASAQGYEGAFKTVIVYRGVDAQVGDNFLKIEATNTRNGAVTIAGFPMWYNDMTGEGSKFAFRNGGANSNSDYIFITWEIVSEFWQVSPVSRSDVYPGVLYDNGVNNNSWYPFSANYQVHNYRTYGNWGMQIGNR